MKITRREALGGMAISALAAGCAPMRLVLSGPKPVVPLPELDRSPEAVALSRFGFGARPGDLEEVAKQGLDAWFESQLAAPEEDPPELMMSLRRLDIMHLSAWELRDYPVDHIVGQMQRATIQRAAHSPWQLRERMVDFWSNHFSVFARKGLTAYRKATDDRDVIRKNALGSFPAMVRGSAKSTAMLLYLDQQASNYAYPNENYARELLELHTLGVNSGYTQKDVMEVARCLTGWTEERGFLKRRGTFKFDPALHDDGAKIVLGHRIAPGGGVEDGEQVLDLVSTHPWTAAHISRKLARFFLGDAGVRLEPELAQVFLETDGDIASMLRTIYQSKVWVGGPPLLKRPFDFAISALRAFDGETDGGEPMRNRLAAMSQPLFEWPMPDGYPDGTEAWTGSMLQRWNFAIAFCRGDLTGTKANLKDLRRRYGGSNEAFLAAAFQAPPTAERLASLRDVVRGRTAAEAAALTICSPEFQWR